MVAEASCRLVRVVSHYFQQRHDPVVEASRLKRRIEALGFEVDLHQKAA